MEPNSLKGSGIQMVHSIVIKFGSYITDHHHITYSIDFGELKINSFFYKSTKNNSYILQLMVSNYKNNASV